jgi:hypothetical protein
MPPNTRLLLSPNQRAKLYVEYKNLHRGPGVRRSAGSVQSLAKKFHVHPKTVLKLVRKIEERVANGWENPFAVARKGGRPTAWSAELSAHAHSFAATNNYEFSYREMASALGTVSTSTVRRHLLESGWCCKRRKARPFLTAAHKAARLKWASAHVRSQWMNHVDIDEKIFCTKVLGRAVKVPQGLDVPCDYPQSRGNIPHIMVITAIARPRPRYNFNGLIGMYRVALPRTAKKSSKHHKAGETYDVDATLNADLFWKLMTREIFPAIKRKMHWALEVTVQVDNARPHTGKGTIKRLNRAGQYPKRKGPRIRVITQPAQSPDTNANDLAFYRSLELRVRQRQRNSSIFDKEILLSHLKEEWRNFPEEELQRVFSMKNEILKLIIKHGGGNDFRVPHRRKNS